MAVPSANTIPRGGTQLRKKGKVRYDIVIGFLLLVTASVYFSILKPTQDAIQQQEVIDMPLKKIDVAIPVETVDSDLLNHEQMFLETIKACIPGTEDTNCGTFIPPNNDNKQRIAIIAPPGQMSNMLWKWVETVLAKHKHALEKLPLEFIRTSHVPPYGYGKSHGLTKIIRLVPRPIVMGVADALQQVIVDTENHHLPGEPLLHQQDITLNDLKAVLRQFMRYHCRLSKLAAHTAILSLNLNDFMDNYEFATQALYDFIKYTPDKNGVEEDDLEDILADLQIGQDGGMEEIGLLSSELGFVSNILTRIQVNSAADGSPGIKVLKVLDEVLLNEMRKTKNLTDWPCESFWTVGEANEPTTLSLFATKVARSFSPNCSAPFADCWVGRDKCEAAGDGLCLGKK
jgi:hypothetical protein